MQNLMVKEYTGYMLFFFENGKVAKVDMSVYATKTNRKRLTGAYSDKSPLRSVLPITDERQIAMFSTEGRALVFNSALLAPKTSRATMGVGVMTLKPKYKLKSAEYLEGSPIVNRARYTARSLPAAGALLKPEDTGETQITMEGE